MEVILTVPHAGVATDTDNTNHPFDYLAAIAARRINKRLSKIYSTHLFLSDTPRAICDINRKQCRNSDFRDILRSLFDSVSSPVYLFDVHSFPRDHATVDLYIFDNRAYFDRGYSVIPTETQELVGALIYEGFSAATFVYDGSLYDIITEAREYNIPGLLLEFCEDLTVGDLDSIALIISRWLGGEFKSEIFY